MAPCHHAKAVVIIVSFLDHLGDLAGRLSCHFINQRIRELFAQPCGHFIRSLCHCLKYFFSVKILGSYYKPKLLHNYLHLDALRAETFVSVSFLFDKIIGKRHWT